MTVTNFLVKFVVFKGMVIVWIIWQLLYHDYILNWIISSDNDLKTADSFLNIFSPKTKEQVSQNTIEQYFELWRNINKYSTTSNRATKAVENKLTIDLHSSVVLSDGQIAALWMGFTLCVSDLEKPYHSHQCFHYNGTSFLLKSQLETLLYNPLYNNAINSVTCNS